MKKQFEELLKVSDREELSDFISEFAFKSLESVCTDRELAKYIKVAIIHFIHNLDMCIDGT